jgi:mono/diheme cytochrome c family protein
MSRLALVCVLCVCAAACSRSVDFERMRQQARADAYEAGGPFGNGMVMRVPPPGAVPAGPRDAASSPAITPDLVARGRQQFETQCVVCHGSDGSGHAVMASNLPDGAELSLVTARTTARTADELFDVVSRGRNRMPAFDWALSADDRWAVVAYMRTLQEQGQ